jgi:hypothetical protein
MSIEPQKLIRTKRLEWRREVISGIRADANGMELNGQPLSELLIHSCAGKKIGKLAGRKEDELRWVATCTLQVLDVLSRKLNA